VVAAELEPYRHRLETVNVDAIGVGAYFAKHLKDLGFPVRSIRVSEKSRNPSDSPTSRLSFIGVCASALRRATLAGLRDEQAISQLATIRYSHNPRGQLIIETKEDARRRGIKSPDRAEAMMLAYAGRRGQASMS
jgi:hypothetical protein